MNTTVEYKTPTFRNRYGQYESLTFCRREAAGYMWIKLRISLVWFNRMGWYYSIDLEAIPTDWKKHKMILDHSSSMSTWSKGPEVALCAEAAERAAKILCEKHGLKPPEFNPYELHRREKDPFDAKQYEARMQADLATK